MKRIMTRKMIAALNLKKGDRVRVTVNEPGVSQVGDVAILTRQDNDTDWWGILEKDDPGSDSEICLTDVAAIEPD